MEIYFLKIIIYYKFIAVFFLKSANGVEPDVRYCRDKSIEQCYEESECDYVHSIKKCITRCIYQGLSKEQCEINFRCQWLPFGKCTEITCAQRQDQNQCSIDSSCGWNGTQCYDLPCNGLPMTSCLQTKCNWSSNEKLCKNKTNCVYRNYYYCQFDPICKFTTSGCEGLYCFNIKNEQLCNQVEKPGSMTNECIWRNGKCGNPCDLITDEEQCLKLWGEYKGQITYYRNFCLWNGFKCQFQCNQHNLVYYTMPQDGGIYGIGVTKYIKVDLEGCKAQKECQLIKYDNAIGDVELKDNPNKQVCQQKLCEDQKNQEDCLSIGPCMWFNNCRKICPHSNDCDSSICKQKLVGPYERCRNKTCEDYSQTEQACTQRGCKYLGQFKCVKKNCDECTNQKDCENVNDCSWFKDSSFCYKKPIFISNVDICIFNSYYIWKDGKGCLLRTCSDNGTPTECRMKSDCKWNGNFCDKTCSKLSQTECQTDPDCFLDGSSCKLQLCSKYIADIDCVQNILCLWKGTFCTQKKCLERLTINDCSIDSNCKWNGLVCTNQCAAITNNNDCSKDFSCKWTDKCYDKQNLEIASELECNLGNTKFIWNGSSCEVKMCQQRYTQVDCSFDSSCYWNGNFCQKLCQKIGSKSDCSANTDCQWDNLSNKCQDKQCMDRINREECIKSEFKCLWDGQICKVKDCPFRRSKTDCQLDKTCKWNGDSCSRQCYLIYIQNICKQDPTCYWNEISNSCLNKQCSEYLDCSQSSICSPIGNTSKCATKLCFQRYNQDDCSFDESCKWDGFLCFKRCQYNYYETLCKQQQGCKWKDNFCIDEDCSDIQSSAKCEDLKRCKIIEGGLCSEKIIQDIKTERECGNNIHYAWNKSRSECFQIPCEERRSSSSCLLGNYGCQWDGIQQSCILKKCQQQTPSQYLDLSPYCANLDMILEGDSQLLNINFKNKFTVVGKEPSLYSTPSNQLCTFLFSKNSMNLIGQSARCSIQESILQVELSSDSQIKNLDKLELNPNILQFISNQTKSLICNFVGNTAFQKSPTMKVNITFKYTKVVGCNDEQHIFIDKILNDLSGRGLFSLTWSFPSDHSSSSSLLSKMTDSDRKYIQEVFDVANQSKQKSIIIKSSQINRSTVNIDLVFSYRTMTWQEGQTFISYQIVQKLVEAIFKPLQKPPFYIFQQIDIQYINKFYICSEKSSNNTPLQVEPYKFEVIWSQDSSQNIPESILQRDTITQSIKPFQFKTFDPLEIIISSSLESQPLAKNITKQILTYSISPLSIQIMGGNRQVDVAKNLIIKGKAADLDIQDQTLPHGINLSWSCFDQIKGIPCVDDQNQPIKFDSTNEILNIKKRTFQPYWNYLIEFHGKKNGRENQDQIKIMVGELDLPVLGTTFQNIDIKDDRVNMNDDIVVILDYDRTVDVNILSFSGAIMYMEEIVGVIKFDYTSLKFKIWDYFTNFISPTNKFQVRFSVYNPFYIMPSISVVDFLLNFPPSNCVLSIQPTSGFSLETDFSITFDKCSDPDSPLEYQFFFYQNTSEFNLEKLFPDQIRRKQLNDRSRKSILNTQLPEGDAILVLSQSIDSRNGIFNSTLIVNVKKQQFSETEYLQIISKKLSSNLLSTEKILDLSLLQQDLIGRPELFSLFSIQQKSLEISHQILDLSSTLTSGTLKSTFYNLANKIVAESTRVANPDSQQQLAPRIISQVSNAMDNIEKLSGSIDQITKVNAKQQIFDSFNLLDSMQNNSAGKQNSTSQDLIYDLVQRIGRTINVMSLPNEDKTIFNGENIIVESMQFTEKYLPFYFFDPKRKLESNKNQKNLNSNYTALISTFTKNNPYINETSFKNYTDTLLKLNPNAKIENREVVCPNFTKDSSQKIQTTNQFYASFNPLPLNSPRQACLSKVKNKWTSSNCSPSFVKAENMYICFCSEPSPVTIIDDLEELLLKNENLDTVFSSAGIENLSHFNNFYRYVVFWVITGFTLTFIVCVFFFKQIDKVQGLTHQQKNQSPCVSPIMASNINLIHSSNIKTDILQQKNSDTQPQQKLQDKDSENQQKNSDKSIHNFKRNPILKLQQSQLQIKPTTNNNLETQRNAQETKTELLTEGQDLLKDSPPILLSRIIYLNDNQEIQKSPQGANNYLVTEVEDVLDEDDPQFNFKEKTQIEKQLSQLENKQSVKVLSQVEVSNQLIEEKNNQKDNNFSDRINNQVDTEKNYEINLIKKTNKFIYFLCFHPIASIYLIFDSKLSRVVRLTLLYNQVIHNIAMSYIFDQEYSIVQLVQLSIINTLIVNIITKILCVFHSKNRILKGVASLLQLSLILFYFYTIGSIISGDLPEVSNQKLEKKFTSLILSDIIFTGIPLSIFQGIILFLLLKAKIRRWSLLAQFSAPQVIEYLKNRNTN